MRALDRSGFARRPAAWQKGNAAVRVIIEPFEEVNIMWRRLFYVFCLVALSCSFSFAQKRSVTNADLEVYKQQRLQADRDYRENYERLGFPSPEELDRRQEQSRKETEELSAKLRTERLERERVEASQRVVTQSAAVYPQYYPYYPYADNTIWGGTWYNPLFGGRRFPRPIRGGNGAQSGYFAGGHFWPGGLDTPKPQPQSVRIHPHH